MKIDPKTRDELTNLYGSLQTLSSVISEIQATEQENFDNKSEEWQESADGEKAQEVIDELDSIVTELEDLADRIDETLF